MATGATAKPKQVDDWETVSSGPSDWETVSDTSPKAAPPPSGNAFQRFSRALGEGNPLSVEQAPSDAEITRRQALPLSSRVGEMFAPLNPMNMIRGIVQPFQELASGEVPEGLGHLIGAGQQGGPQGGPASAIQSAAKTAVRLPLKAMASTPGAAIIGGAIGHHFGGYPGTAIGGYIGRDLLPGLAKRGLSALEDAPAAASPAVTPMSPRFKGPIPEPEAPAAAPATIAKPTTPPFTSMTPNPPNLRDWLRGGPETVPGRIGTTPVWRGLPEPTTPTAPPTTAIPATKTISGRTPGMGPDPFVGPTRPLEPAVQAPTRVTLINERPNTITSPETAPAVDVNPREAASRSSLAQKMGEKLAKSGAPVTDVAKLPNTDPFWKTLEDSVRPGEKSTRSQPPSADTIQLAREHHQRLMGQQAPLAKPFVPGSSLTGRSLDIAKQLQREMGQ